VGDTPKGCAQGVVKIGERTTPFADSGRNSFETRRAALAHHPKRGSPLRKPNRENYGSQRLFLAVANLRPHAALFAPQLSPTLS
jgi:hypothetical protein